MQLWLADRLVRDRIDPTTFFRAAYMAAFGRDLDISRDVLEYRVAGIIPPYVREYVIGIQQKERKDALQTL